MFISVGSYLRYNTAQPFRSDVIVFIGRPAPRPAPSESRCLCRVSKRGLLAYALTSAVAVLDNEDRGG